MIDACPDLDDVAGALNEVVKRIHQTYGFKTLYVTAQSMGGLVARSFIMKNVYDDEQDYIKLFVSISTPWNGHRLTAKGVEGAPTAIPSWHDMIPESEFIKTIFQHRFPPRLKFYLLFSYRGNCSLLLQNNDGTVELEAEGPPDQVDQLLASVERHFAGNIANVDRDELTPRGVEDSFEVRY